MIPDFPKVKFKLQEFWNIYLYQKHQEKLGFWSSLPSRRHHEGSGWHLYRSNGTSESIEYTQMSTRFEVNLKDVPNLTFEDIRKKFDLVAEDMASQMSQGLFQKIISSAQKIDGKNQTFGIDMLLEALESIDIDFDNMGNPSSLSVIIPPQIAEKMKNDLPNWEKDPEHNARYEEIISRKRIEWRDRESNRKLVD